MVAALHLFGSGLENGGGSSAKSWPIAPLSRGAAGTGGGRCNRGGAPSADAIRENGGGRLLAFCYGTLPGVWPQLVAYSLYRWENNIRMASVLGFVGAGGLGQMLYMSLSLFQEAQAATVILAMLLLVLAVDALSGWARQRWVSA